jgi:flagellar assembly protein FliH
LSSEPAPAPAATVAEYTFEQLDGPNGTSVDEIADLLSSVRAEADEMRERARAAGEAEGRAAGLAQAHEQAAPALAALSEALRGIEQLRAELVAQLEQDAVEIALRLAEHVLAGTLSVEPERVIDVTRNALRHFSDRRRVTLVVNPADLEILHAAVDQLRGELGGIEHLAVQADRRVGRGGAIATTEAGEIDSSIETQLARAREVIAAALAGEVIDGR